MKQSISFSSYLFKVLIIAVLFITLPMLFSFGGNFTTTGAYIRSCLCFFTLTVISAYLVLGEKYVRYYSFAFIILLIIGLMHYLLFIDSNYFNSQGAPVVGFWHEFSSVFNSIETLINNRLNSSLFYFDSSDWDVSHPEIWQIITIPFTFLGNKWLNYSPLNVFSSLFASINLMALYNRNSCVGNDKNSVHKLILVTTSFFPLFLLNDTLWRDAFGVALISTGLVLLTLSDRITRKVLSLIVLAYFSFLLRSVYIFVAGFVFAIMEIDKKKNIASVVTIPLAALLLYFISNYYQSNTSEEYVGMYVNQMSFFALPLKILFGLIGPFPWTQFMMAFEGRVAISYQLSDYILGVFQLGYLIAIIIKWNQFSFKNLDYLTLMGFGIAFSGFVSSSLHIGYIAEGLYFTLPWFFSQIGDEYKKYFRISFFILLLLNIIVIMVGGFGISRLWR